MKQYRNDVFGKIGWSEKKHASEEGGHRKPENLQGIEHALPAADSPVTTRRVRNGAGFCGGLVAHNHPSGDPTLSPEDIEVTKRLVQLSRSRGLKSSTT